MILYTYEKIVDIFREACDEHLAINTFSTGPISHLDSDQNVTYPYMFLRPMTSTGLIDNVKTYNFELYSLDIPKLQDESSTSIMSDTELWLTDIGAYFNRGIYQKDILFTILNITPVNEAFNDRAYGWAASIDIEVPFVYNNCTFPK